MMDVNVDLKEASLLGLASFFIIDYTSTINTIQIC